MKEGTKIPLLVLGTDYVRHRLFHMVRRKQHHQTVCVQNEPIHNQ